MLDYISNMCYRILNPLSFEYGFCEEKRMDYNDNYINLEDAATYMCITPGTLRNWMKNPENEVPAHRIGRAWKFKKKEIDDWVDSGKAAKVR